MNKILVLIDLNTLKRNPDAGKTERRICVGKSATLKTDCQISDPRFEGLLQSGKVEHLYGVGTVAAYTYGIPAELIEEAQQLGELTIENHYETSRVFSHEPAYLYGHIRPVVCPLCGTIHHSHLDFTPDWGDDEDCDLPRRCPACLGEVEIELESAKSALARIAEIIGGGDA
jgi:hypothetical protein